MAYQNGTTTTCTIEPPSNPDTIELQNKDTSHHHLTTQPEPAKKPPALGFSLHETSPLRESQQNDDNDPVVNLPSPTTQGAERLERWNSPRLNLWRSGAAFWSFVVMGSNDAAYGVSRAAADVYLRRKRKHANTCTISVLGTYSICKYHTISSKNE
jgi:hypothetical protein